jgi:hypothetical protein
MVSLEFFSERWENNIKNESSTGRGGLDRIKLAQYEDIWRCSVNTIMNLWVA